MSHHMLMCRAEPHPWTFCGECMLLETQEKLLENLTRVDFDIPEMGLGAWTLNVLNSQLHVLLWSPKILYLCFVFFIKPVCWFAHVLWADLFL